MISLMPMKQEGFGVIAKEMQASSNKEKVNQLDVREDLAIKKPEVFNTEIKKSY